MSVDELVEWARGLPEHECEWGLLWCGICGAPRPHMPNEAWLLLGQQMAQGTVSTGPR